ncbi:hypothetical protein Ae201684P_015329 [Aphanomyces euteiches]|uniref:RxLR effector protein n=1 Tax=Aphanomyces euteiches TaxID=100861 RepID=A0A6G0XFK2_9STRA|nr:hypothetical protein Ae201684_005304 [Aphanomyces euteiches]KAH9053565.1 hypothetical protein Ae201684P_015329 [Aphanomyces euteiches]
MKTSIIVAAVALSAASAATFDMRSSRAPNKRQYAVRSKTWQGIKVGSGSDGWIKRNLRCSRQVFMKIVSLVNMKWSNFHAPLHHNTVFGIEDRVAITLHYSTHSDGLDQTAQLFGTSKTRGHVYIYQVIYILNKFYLREVVALPRTSEE